MTAPSRPGLTLARLFVIVTLLGLAYAGLRSWKGNEKARARDCRVNQNLIDRYIGFWEARHGYLAPRSGPLSVDLDTAGAIAKLSPEVPLQTGSRAIAEIARDPEAFYCPEAGSPAASARVHYRWVLALDPLRELSGRTRGTVCLLHGEQGPGDDPATRHAW